jgi:DNA-binding transcriptional ArsR family regulator
LSANADYSVMADQTPDYELADSLELDNEQLRTLFEPTRKAIIELLGERAATTSELADALGKPKGTIGHHCKSLEAAGLIRVVRTRQARAMVAKYYGRTARTFILDHVDEIGFTSGTMLHEAIAEIERFHRANPTVETAGITSLRFARIPHDRAEEWAERLAELVTEFTREPRAGDRMFGLAVSLFPTTKPVLPEEAP